MIIERSALVGYTARQMFELVNNIEDYPRFLPWCSASKVIEQSENEVTASIEIHWSGMSKNFTTRNILVPYEEMQMQLVSGPFKNFVGRWSFASVGDQGCKVSMLLEFEFTGGMFDRLFQPIFNTIANSLVDAFCKRAVDVYGLH